MYFGMCSLALISLLCSGYHGHGQKVIRDHNCLPVDAVADGDGRAARIDHCHDALVAGMHAVGATSVPTDVAGPTLPEKGQEFDCVREFKYLSERMFTHG